MRPQKFIDVADRLAARIRNGDYHLNELPAERELAVEAGVSYATARKAVQTLVEKGLLRRLANGRAAPLPAVNGVNNGTPAQIALLTPAWQSSALLEWRHALAKACENRQASIRTVLFTHWDDPVIATTVQGFDGTFLMPSSEPRTEPLMKTLRESGRPIIVLESDWSDAGLRSVVMNPGFCAHRLLDHLASLGHRKIDYFNVQPGHTRFLNPWRLWLAAQHLDGDCIDEPVKPYEDTLPAAYALIDRLIRNRKFNSKALFCTTGSSAFGAMSAMLDHGIRPGHDVAVCTADSGAGAAFYNPSLTSLVQVDMVPYAVVCLDWMMRPTGKSWSGPLLLQPDSTGVVARQSTVPDARKSRRLS